VDHLLRVRADAARCFDTVGQAFPCGVRGLLVDAVQGDTQCCAQFVNDVVEAGGDALLPTRPAPR
jgi:hypothetical protein